MNKNNGVLIYDTETEVIGNNIDGERDKLKVFGYYSYLNESYGVIPYTKKDAIQKVLNAHKFLVGFNNIEYDNPVLKSAGMDLNYKRCIDLRQIIKQRAKAMKTSAGLLDEIILRYSLDNITRVLGLVTEEEAKEDIDYRIFNKNTWTKEEIQQIKLYTERDIEITKRLYEWVEEYFKSAKDFISQRDSENKIYLTKSMAGVVYHAICNAMDWEPVFNKDAGTVPEEDRISGGYVSYPAGEAYADYDIIELDYSSLYPHVMIQANLYGRNTDDTGWHGGGMWDVKGYYDDTQMSTVSKLLRKWYYLRMFFKRKGVLIDGSSFTFKDAHKYIGNTFLQPSENNKVLDLEEVEITSEKADELKALHEQGKDEREYMVKININSAFGLLNNPFYQLVYDSVAGGDCTRLARQYTKYARKVFREAGYPMLYTDSVAKDSRIRLKNSEEVTVEEYWNRYTRDVHSDDKEMAKCVEPILTCDDSFRNKLVIPDKIIRHKTHKKMYRLYFTNCEYVDVTENHSLITINPETQEFETFTPDKINNIKYVLKNNKNKRIVSSKKFSKELYFLMGHILGNGNIYKQTKSKKYNYISLSDNYIEDVKKKILKKLQNEYNFNMESKGKATDITINSTILAEKLHSWGFGGKSYTKSVSSWLYKETDENIKEFIKGYFSADGDLLFRKNKPIVRASSINYDLLKGVDNLLKILGYRTSIYKENKKTSYKDKISKYNMFYLNILDKYRYLKEINFIYDVKEIEGEDTFIWFGDNKLAKKKSSYINKNNKILSTNLNKQIYSDFCLYNIRKVETFYVDDYVYDFSIEGAEKFYANDILVHNTDSWYFIDVYHDKDRVLRTKQKVIDDIKESMPFPQYTFDADIDAEIKHMFFFRSDKKDRPSDEDEEMDEDDYVNKRKGLMKKNYIYVTKDDELVIKNLGIKKKNISALSKKIFWDHLAPRIKSEGRVKFAKTEIENLIKTLLREDITLAYMRKEAKPVGYYKETATGIEKQISEKYGPGTYFLIPNIRGIGVGKNVKYCTKEEFDRYTMDVSDIDFSKFWNELAYFVKQQKQPTLFDM